MLQKEMVNLPDNLDGQALANCLQDVAIRIVHSNSLVLSSLVRISLFSEYSIT